MTLFQWRSLTAGAALALCSGAASAHLYGYVDAGRVSVIYADSQPSDPRYKLFRKIRPGLPVTPADASPALQGKAPVQYSSHILAAARETQVDAALIRAVISVESGYNPSARSSAGAVGLMQLMPETARRYGVKNRLNPAQNIQGGARYLRDLKALFDNDLKLVLAAYNAGEQAVFKYGGQIPPFRETAAYVPKVLGYYAKFSAARAAGG